MKRITENKIQDYEIFHQETVRKFAPECTLFLKRDRSFPIESGKIAAYGNGVRHTIKGGTGSGDVNVRHMVNVEEGLLNAGFVITTTKWLDQYDKVLESARLSFVKNQQKGTDIRECIENILAMGNMQEPEYEIPLNGEGSAAIYVLARISGEGNDRSEAAGDIALTETEKRDILALNEQYSQFMLVLNTGGLVDLSPVKEVKNILLLGQLGSDTGNVLADILTGKSYPSGKLAMTWTRLSEYPSTKGFGDKNDTIYHEGIFVGYRYFDTYHQAVLYPFGYGLGYTDFEVGEEKVTFTENHEIRIIASVKNTGEYLGKEVVQVYVSAPSEKLERPFQELAAFTKTKELEPGKEEQVFLCFSLLDLAGYDEECEEYLLEKGEYIFRIGTSSKETKICGSMILKKTMVIDRKVLKENGPAIVDEKIEKFAKRLSERQLAELCVGDFSGEAGMESVIGVGSGSVAGGAGETTRRLSDVGLEKTIVMADGPAGVRLSPIYKIINGKVQATSAPFSGDMMTLLDQEELKAMVQGNQPTEELEEQEYYQYCSAIPIGTDLAQSFNCELASAMGNIVAEEMQIFGAHLWLAPAMNIQRNPLCGRNFEYFSEDPLLSGLIGAAMTIGVQRHKHCGVAIKHFACNNQETNRYTSNSVLSERALRDIYLKGFEICIKKSQPYTVMSSYNLINGEHVCNRKDLIDGMLREKWGFKGIVMTDWFVTTDLMSDPASKYAKASAAGCVKAGNDLIMPGMESDVQDILKALESDTHPYHLTRQELEMCAVRILEMIDKLAG